MKTASVFIRILVFVFLITANITVFSQFLPDLLPSDSAYLASVPVMILSPESAQLSLPIEVDNSSNIYFPNWDEGGLYMYNQTGETASCQSVATVFFTFTYEINRLRNVASNTQQTRYAPNFSWNHLNKGFCGWQGYTGLDVVQIFLQQSGAMSDLDFDGEADLNALDCHRWVTGYDLYLNSMHNKLDHVQQFIINQDGSGLDILKHYLYDHNEGSDIGGLVTFGAKDYGVPVVELLEPSAYAGQFVRYKMNDNVYHGHAVTIVGYCDDVMYDWGGAGTPDLLEGDGEIRNDKDNNLDGILDMRDWEIGALKVANSYGDVPQYNNEGFEWVLYCCLPTYNNSHRNEFFALTPKENNDPEVVIKLKIEDTERDNLKLYCGYGLTADDNTYLEAKSFMGYITCGGPYPIQGTDENGNNINGPIEILLDFSYYFPNIDFGKVFLEAYDTGSVVTGTVINYSLIDYRWNEVFELPYTLSNFPVGDPQILGINYDLIPHENDISLDLELSSDMVSRFNPAVSHNATLTIGEDVLIDMYNSEITINEGSALIIEDNAIIVAKTGICKLTINGNVSVGSNVTFKAEGESQLQIYINNYMVDAVFGNCTFENASLNTYNRSNILSNCIFTNSSIHGNHGNFEISQCDFFGSYAHFLDDMPTLDEKHVNITNNCSFEDVTMPIALEINSYPNFRIQNSSVINCGNAIFIYNSGYGRGDQIILNNNISGNSYTGITAYRSYVDIIDNIIENNNIGVKSFDRSVMHLGGNFQTVTQIIKDNTSYEVYASEGSFPQYFHWNLIQDDDNIPGDPLVKYTGSASFFDVRNNCWGSNFDPSTDLFPSGYIWNPIWYCFSAEGIPISSVSENLYLDALNAVENEDYAGAKSDLKQIVTSDPTSIYAEAALKELYSVEAFDENDFTELSNYYASDSNILSTPDLASLSDFLMNLCEIKLENWPTAIDWFENVIISPDSFEDSIFAIIDLEYTYLLMENSGMKSSYCGSLSQYRPHSRNQFEADRNYLLSLLPGNSSSSYADARSKLANGKLNQNIPNPFYSKTQIPYEVIRDSKVEIFVYNNIGQIVKSCNEGIKRKGLYNFTFDGTGLPDGIYYYSISMEGKLIDSRKMALIK